MEVVEEDLSELCAEILKNWTSPANFDKGQNSLHQNPFSLEIPIYPQELSNASNDKYIRNVESNSFNGPQVSCNTNSVINGDMEFHIELEQKQGVNKICENGSKYEQAEKSNDTVSVEERPTTPVLAADPFSDELDCIDIAALNKSEEVMNKFDEDGDNLSAIMNDNEMEQLAFTQRLSGFKCNTSMVDRMPSGSLLSYESRCMADTCTAAPTKINGFIAKSKIRIPSNKTIFDVDIDNIEDKLWRMPGVDLSDFFNYGLDEKQWKGYCKLMLSEVNMNTGLDDCLPFSLNDSDVIIEILMHDSLHKNGSRREDAVLTDAECANPLLDDGNTQNINCRMINGNDILPFPMDGHSNYLTEQWFFEQKYQRSCGKEIVELAGCNELERDCRSKEERHFRRSNQKKVGFSVGQEQGCRSNEERNFRRSNQKSVRLSLGQKRKRY